MTHTPTPWTEGKEQTLIVASATDIFIGSISFKNDRAFIIEACNNYDKLVGNCEAYTLAHSKCLEEIKSLQEEVSRLKNENTSWEKTAELLVVYGKADRERDANAINKWVEEKLLDLATLKASHRELLTALNDWVPFNQEVMTGDSRLDRSLKAKANAEKLIKP